MLYELTELDFFPLSQMNQAVPIIWYLYSTKPHFFTWFSELIYWLTQFALLEACVLLCFSFSLCITVKWNGCHGRIQQRDSDSWEIAVSAFSVNPESCKLIWSLIQQLGFPPSIDSVKTGPFDYENIINSRVFIFILAVWTSLKSFMKSNSSDAQLLHTIFPESDLIRDF